MNDIMEKQSVNRFHGRLDEDPEDWLGHIELVQMVYKVDEDELKIARTGIYMRDTAFSWFIVSRAWIDCFMAWAVSR